MWKLKQRFKYYLDQLHVVQLQCFLKDNYQNNLGGVVGTRKEMLIFNGLR